MSKDVLYYITTNAIFFSILIGFIRSATKNIITEKIEENNKDFSEILHISIQARIKDSVKNETDRLHKRITDLKESFSNRVGRLEYGHESTEKELGRMSIKIESIQQELRVIEKNQNKAQILVEEMDRKLDKVTELLEKKLVTIDEKISKH